MADVITLLMAVSLRIAGVCAAACLVALTLRRSSAAARHMAWTWAIAAAVLTPLLLQLPVRPLVVPAALTGWTSAPQAPPAVDPAVPNPPAGTSDPVPASITTTPADAGSASSVTFAFVAVALWAAGAALSLLWVANGIIATGRLRRRATPSAAAWQEEAGAIAAAMGVGRVTFVESAATPSPFTFGITSPVVVMPIAVATWTSERRRAVLLHELAHVKRRDCLAQLLARIACALYWFHPCIWFAARRLRIERERACDDVVLTSGMRGSVYGHHLLDIARSAVSPVSAFAAGGVAMAHRGRLEERLVSILDPHAVRTSPLSARLIVTLFGLLALGATSLRVHAQAPPPSPAIPGVTFEVASIRRNKVVEDQRRSIDPNIPQVPGRAQTLPGGTLQGRGMTVRELIRDAYGYRNRAQGDVVGGPGWINTEVYDVQAKADRPFPPSTSQGLPPEAEAALRALLAERLNLKVRIESQLRPVYELVVQRADGRLGPNLKPSTAQCRPFFQREAIAGNLTTGAQVAEGVRRGQSPLEAATAIDPALLRPCPLSIVPGMIRAENMTMADWVKVLALTPQLNRTVVDRTGLTGGYDIQLGGGPAAREAVADNLLPAVQPALERDLGLTLRDGQAPVDVLIIESVDHPSEN
jgi:uncharacterized protein (TIGR03435 family)